MPLFYFFKTGEEVDNGKKNGVFEGISQFFFFEILLFYEINQDSVSNGLAMSKAFHSSGSFFVR